MLTSLAFFATIDEERAWLARILPTVDWCVVDEVRPERRSVVISATDLLGYFGAVELGESRVFMGRRALSQSPIWRQAGQRRELDVVRSRVIQFVPSLAIGEVLIEGRIDVLDSAAYSKRDIDPRPIQDWFREARRLLVDVLCGTTTSEEDARGSRVGSTVFSSGAIAWFRGGGRLKQFLESNIEISPPKVQGRTALPD